MPNKKKGVSKKTVKTAMSQVRSGQKRQATAKQKVSNSLKKQSTLRSRQTTKAKSVRQSDNAMRARRKAYNK